MSPLKKAEYEALATFRYALRRFLQFSEAAAEAVGLTPQQHQALLAIKGFPGRETITVGELAERLQIRHHSAVGLVDRLTAQGLVKRQHGDSDHREVYVNLTNEAEMLLAQLSSAHKAELKNVAPAFADLIERLGRPED